LNPALAEQIAGVGQDLPDPLPFPGPLRGAVEELAKAADVAPRDLAQFIRPSFDAFPHADWALEVCKYTRGFDRTIAGEVRHYAGYGQDPRKQRDLEGTLAAHLDCARAYIAGHPELQGHPPARPAAPRPAATPTPLPEDREGIVAHFRVFAAGKPAPVAAAVWRKCNEELKARGFPPAEG
jgi:hypothetical protein